MNTVRFETLLESDISPYTLKATFVRIYGEADHWWYAGKLHRVKIEERRCVLGMDPYGRFGYHEVHDPEDPGIDAFITGEERPVARSLVLYGQAFRLIEPQRIVWEREIPEILGIKAENGTAILSCRDTDKKAVIELLGKIEHAPPITAAHQLAPH